MRRLLFIWAWLWASAIAVAATPYAISYSGRMLDGAGKPFEGPRELEVKFFDAVIGGNQLGPTTTLHAVVLVDGVFQ